ncbi:helix-turn-helix domain-containing protein [Leptospira mayottensis]|uniref:DNA-binding helix-turn-helix protein n=2 Tax=Leptospira mayottensis TaxID=1137606 RepID=A0AA87SX90_9LEPT|nr:helix-turn-helix domain-containing protein [Leptospira mayottensis]AXR59857.1 DNA-binding protein [Leptospira mayottensis]AXR63896.1 DNA-binding protein [Leptospira mayottensis]AZQ00820.1 DNA-binding protein [Leptospira mayottensis 200901116]EKR99930.1 DNA-binding helix-turn-helix protein [Leptospira mayottensis 200901122]TGN09060.1 DNA-binding protein [Leptospira mayottensis]
MFVINGNTRKGSLLKSAQFSDSEKENLIRDVSSAKDKTQVLKTKEAARYLNLSVRTFNQYVIDHEIPFIQWSSRVRRFMIGDLDKIVLSRKTKKQIY